MKPIEAGTRNYYPTTLILAARGYHPEYQSFFYLLISALFFGATAYCNAHTGDGDAMFVFKIYVVFAVLIGSRRPLLRARTNMADFIRRFGFGFIWLKGACTLFFFAFFNWLGNKLLTHKDIFIVLATVFFFLHLVLLQDIYLMTDDLGIAQGVLLAGFGVVLADSTSYNLPHVIGYDVAFSFFLAVLNTKKPPAIPLTTS